MESTYGGRLHNRNDDKAKMFLNIVSDTLEKGGTVVIPSFAVGRTQEILYELNNLKEEKLVKYETYGIIELTEQGENLAQKILEAYDIVYLFLKDVLDLDEQSAKEEAEKIAEKLSKILLKIKVKSGANGKIFGGVSAKDISEAFEKQHNIKIDKKKIDLKETIKTLGIHTVSIKLFEGVIGKIKVDVIG